MQYKLWSRYLLDCLLVDVCVGVGFILVTALTTFFLIKK